MGLTAERVGARVAGWLLALLLLVSHWSAVIRKCRASLSRQRRLGVGEAKQQSRPRKQTPDFRWLTNAPVCLAERAAHGL